LADRNEKFLDYELKQFSFPTLSNLGWNRDFFESDHESVGHEPNVVVASIPSKLYN